jgi:hypothetical protein
VAVGDYEQLESRRRAAWKYARHTLYHRPKEEHEAAARDYDALDSQRETYLRDLLARLPFSWHVEHAYTPRETAMYGGADHVVVDEPVRLGRLRREPGDALSRPRAKFWGLSRVADARLPTSLADIKIAERIVAALSAEKPPKTSAQIEREIAEALGDKAPY